MIREFRQFVLRGNVVDMAVGIIIGVAFGAVVTSAVKDVIMPPIGLALGRVDFANLFAMLQQGKVAGPYPSLAEAQAAGAVTINYGVFINTIINFLIVAAVVFFFVIRPMVRMQASKKVAAPAAPTTRDCPFCLSAVPLKASRCAHCTSELKPI